MLNPCAPKRLCRRRLRLYVCVHVYVCACMHACVACVHVRVCVCECACVCIHACVCVHTCVCVCVLGRVWDDRMDETGRQRGKHSLEERLKSLPPLCCSFPSWGLGFGTAPSHLPLLCDASPSATVTWSYPKLFPRAPSESLTGSQDQFQKLQNQFSKHILQILFP